MSDALSFAEFHDQHAELLPPRTVLSLLSTGLGEGGDGGHAGAGGPGRGGLVGLNGVNIDALSGGFNSAADGVGSAGGSAHGSRA